MSFSNLTFLQFFALLAVCGLVLVILHRRRFPASRVVVPNLALWAIVCRHQSSKLLLRKRLLLSLALHLLIVLLLALGLAEPRPVARGLFNDSTGRAVAVVVDASLSMQARNSANISRIEVARSNVEGFVHALGPNDRLLVVTFLPSPSIVLAPRMDAGRSLEKISALGTVDSAIDLPSGLELAAAILEANPFKTMPKSLILLTDRVFSGTAAASVSSAPDRHPEVQFYLMDLGMEEAESENLALSRFFAWRPTKAPEFVHMLAEIRNHGKEARDLRLKVVHGTDPILSVPLRLQGREVYSEVFDGLRLDPLSDALSAFLEVNDSISGDNAAFSDLGPPRVRVAVSPEAGDYLLTALRLHPEVALAAEGAEAEPVNLVILRNARIRDASRASSALVLINPLDGNLAQSLATLPENRFDWHPQHLIARGMQSVRFRIPFPRPIRTLPDDEVLLSVDGNPLIVSRNWERRKMLLVGFDLQSSGFPNRLEFPLFVSNVVEWSRRPALLRHWTGQHGEVFVPHIGNTADHGGELLVTDPSGERIPFAERNGILFFTVARQGLYQLATASAEVPAISPTTLAVNFDTQWESDLLEKAELKGWSELEPDYRRLPSWFDWRTLLILGMVALFTEWVLFRRGVTW